MNLEWFTIGWLMANLHWFILLLIISITILFFFPLLLGYDLKKKVDKVDEQNNE